jgi:hypothetical protein
LARADARKKETATVDDNIPLAQTVAIIAKERSVCGVCNSTVSLQYSMQEESFVFHVGLGFGDLRGDCVYGRVLQTRWDSALRCWWTCVWTASASACRAFYF